MDNMELVKKAEEYLNLEKNEYFKDDLQKVLDEKDYNELNERFYTGLSFGTGGLRGVIGGGYNRMNPFTVRKATQGLADYINAQLSGAVLLLHMIHETSRIFSRRKPLLIFVRTE